MTRIPPIDGEDDLEPQDMSDDEGDDDEEFGMVVEDRVQASDDDPAPASMSHGMEVFEKDMRRVHGMFKALQQVYGEKFKAMWA